MGNKLVFLATALLSLVYITQSQSTPSPPSTEIRGLSNVYASLKECCPSMPVFYQETAVATCIQAAPAPKKKGFGKSGGKRQNCLMQCIFNASGFVNTPSNSLNVAALTDKLTTLAVGTPWVTIVPEALKNCTTNIPPPPPSGEPSCDTGAYNMSSCLIGYMVDNCPNQQVNNVPAKECRKRVYAIAKQLEGKGNPLGKVGAWKDKMKKRGGPNNSAALPPANTTSTTKKP